MATKAKATYGLKQAKADWAKLANRELATARQIRAQRATIVKRLVDNGYSDTAIAQGLGISKPEVGKLVAGAIAKRAGFDVSATLDAIEVKGSPVTVREVKALNKEYKSNEDLKVALQELGLTETKTTTKRKATHQTISTRTANAVKNLEKIAESASNGKTSLAVIAETFETLLADLKAQLMG